MDETAHTSVTQDAPYVNARGFFYDSTRTKPFVFIQFAGVAEL